ncbi:Rna exonuclease [Thalictrum thalictroides]|uniref:Rna exonuclease n=1 Tax=Thalictrum thalictroides TaxID=46969 RepID=A0A7J6V926_THATH|nr:Rna exonuclease [Thalictrum thalictroides]
MGAKEWEDMIVGYFVDKKLPYSLVKSIVEKRWKLEGQVEILLDGDLFYFNFKKPEDRDYVLDEGSFHMLGKLFIIRPWTRSVEEDRGQISSIPLWVNFYKVPKFLWNPKGLNLIASVVGKPICADKNTEVKKMLTFARICIEVDATKELPLSIPIKTSSKSCIIDVEYVWKPLLCT